MTEQTEQLKSLLNQLKADKYTLDDRIQEIEQELLMLERGQDDSERE